MHELDDILIAFGESDEYSFLFRKSTDLYQRREAKIVSTVVSLFTSAYVYYWSDYFQDSRRPLYPPVFDGRAVLYPSEVEVKDYFAWRQADTHINNLFNTSFWALVEKGGLTPKAAEIRLSVRSVKAARIWLRRMWIKRPLLEAHASSKSGIPRAHSSSFSLSLSHSV